jgi:hypothetical protein
MLLRSIHGGRLARCCTGSGTLRVVHPLRNCSHDVFKRRTTDSSRTIITV